MTYCPETNDKITSNNPPGLLKAFILVSLNSQHQENLNKFIALMKRIAPGTPVHVLHGDNDFLIEFQGKDLNELYRFRQSILSESGFVRNTRTHIAIANWTAD